MKIYLIYNFVERSDFLFRVVMCFIFLFMVQHSVLNSQNSSSFRGIQAEVIPGLNFSQLDGDRLSGFNKLGLNSGLRFGSFLKGNEGISLGMFFDQRGSRSNLLGIGNFNQHISLNYISWPLSLHYYSWWMESYNRHKINFYGSIIPARLFKITSSHSEFDQATDKFKKWDVSLGFGIAYAMGPRASFNLRIERSLLKIYNIPSSNISGLQSYLVSFQYSYLLNEDN